MYTTLEPVEALTTHPQVRRHLTVAERASLRIAVWVLTQHLRRAASREQREVARLRYEQERAREERAAHALRLAAWHLNAR
ncbi:MULTISPECIES: hypothetical protein [Microbacterium]|uniref:Uncharacterized protein n=1 Tax=Microbacterium schleiferi TaxID=69362 RepID=A0ABU7V667_9MICO|nr:hypothetical protein [Microbacterium sp. 67-17]MBD3753352.1 hypothetical protein [Micrococcales bacterium]OJV94112.1 MAG: hypothetical protein BGO47_08365 [Microbacterium sp. 67-17]